MLNASAVAEAASAFAETGYGATSWRDKEKHFRVVRLVRG
jgi:hypothetical protein